MEGSEISVPSKDEGGSCYASVEDEVYSENEAGTSNQQTKDTVQKIQQRQQKLDVLDW